jgi:hypothetical protein
VKDDEARGIDCDEAGFDDGAAQDTVPISIIIRDKKLKAFLIFAPLHVIRLISDKTDNIDNG